MSRQRESTLIVDLPDNNEISATNTNTNTITNTNDKTGLEMKILDTMLDNSKGPLIVFGVILLVSSKFFRRNIVAIPYNITEVSSAVIGMLLYIIVYYLLS
jgi:hypothetical protein